MGYIYLKRPHVVPVTYFFDRQSNSIICYSGDGHKMNAMRKNVAVSLQVSEIYAINDWKSVLVHGVFEQHFGSDAKFYLHKFSLGIKDIILTQEHKKANVISDFSSKTYKEDIPTVFIIKMEDVTDKKRTS